MKWIKISETEKISTEQMHNNLTYNDILKKLKANERIADYVLLQKLKNEGKLPEEFWVFVPNPDKISNKNGYVAGFLASSGGAYLDCYGIPTVRDSSLGVFVVRQLK